MHLCRDKYVESDGTCSTAQVVLSVLFAILWHPENILIGKFAKAAIFILSFPRMQS